MFIVIKIYHHTPLALGVHPAFILSYLERRI
jgi:hypothetical protein